MAKDASTNAAPIEYDEAVKALNESKGYALKPGQRARIYFSAAKLVDRGWTQRVMARDQFGEEVAPIDDEAICWCGVAALQRATYDAEGRGQGSENKAVALIVEAGAITGVHNLATWNDSIRRTSGEVVELFQRLGTKWRAESIKKRAKEAKTHDQT